MAFRLALVLLLLAAFSPIGRAQPIPDKARVAYLSTLASAQAATRIASIKKAVAGRMSDKAIEYRTFRYELPASAAGLDGQADPEATRRNAEIHARNQAEILRLLAWNPTVILAPGALPAKAAAQRTSTIPIVFGCKCNPLPDGFDLIRNPKKPEANVTGFTRYLIDAPTDSPGGRLNLHEKRLDLLRTFLVPQPLKRVGAIHGDSYDEGKWKYSDRARAMGIEWVPVRLRDSTIDELPRLLREARVDAGLVLADTFLDKNTRLIVEAARKAPVPVLFPWDEADIGALMHYGTVVDFNDTTAYYVQKLLSGTPVSELPVRFPDATELAFNLRTAREQGWSSKMGPGFQAEVDRWIGE